MPHPPKGGGSGPEFARTSIPPQPDPANGGLPRRMRPDGRDRHLPPRDLGRRALFRGHWHGQT